MKQTIILIGLLSVSLLGSYLTWTAESDEVSEDGIAVFAANKPTKIVYTSQNSDVTIERRDAETGEYTWVTVTDRKTIKKPKAPAPSTPDPDAPQVDESAEEAPPEEQAAPEEPEFEEEVETTTSQFRGNDTSDELWAGFSPLMAIRTLDITSSDDTLGFGGEKGGTLIVEQGGKENVTIEIGGETYGSKDRYLRYNGTLYLVDDKHLRSVSSAKARLVERRVHPLGEKEIERVSIHYGDQQTTLVQKNADDRAAAFWAREGEDEADSAAGTWLGKLFRLKVQSYEDSEGVPLVPDFSVTVEGKGNTWTIEVLKSGDESNPDYFAKSNFNQGFVRLTKSIASDASEDITSIFNAVEVSP